MSVYTKKIQVTSGIFYGYTARKRCITILYHAIESTVAKSVGRLGEIQFNTSDRWEGSVEC